MLMYIGVHFYLSNPSRVKQLRIHQGLRLTKFLRDETGEEPEGFFDWICFEER